MDINHAKKHLEVTPTLDTTKRLELQSSFVPFYNLYEVVVLCTNMRYVKATYKYKMCHMSVTYGGGKHSKASYVSSST